MNLCGVGKVIKMTNTKVILKRVSYGWGNFNLPEMDREYHIVKIGNWNAKGTSGASAVGTIVEICKYLEKQGLHGVNFEIHDKGKITMMKNINVVS